MRTISALGLLVLLTASAPGADEAPAVQYDVRGRFVQVEDKAEPAALPVLTVLAGRSAEYRTGGSHTTTGTALLGGFTNVPIGGLSLRVTVRPAGDGKARVRLAVEKADHQYTSTSSTVFRMSVTTERIVRLGKRTRVVLKTDEKGAAKSWLELTVTEATE